jgi:hypothetical protein
LFEGWYRDCGTIPHTGDADLTMFADEYEDKIKQTFLGNPKVNIWLSLGMKRKAYEFRMSGCDFTFDLFFMYKLSEKRYCSYYHVNKIIR